MTRLGSAAFVWRFMAPLPPLWRLHQVVRSLLLPSQPIIDQLPPPNPGGQPLVLLDLGCGHGVFLALARRGRPDLELVGLDLSEEKIASARKVFGASPAGIRELAVRDIANFPGQSVDVVTILDVMYLVPDREWEGIFRKCYDCLRPGGRLLLKEMNPDLRWKFRLLQLEETLAVRIFGLTMAKTKRFTFPASSEIRARLKRVGFTVEEHPIDRGYSAPHTLWIGIKPAA